MGIEKEPLFWQRQHFLYVFFWKSIQDGVCFITSCNWIHPGQAGFMACILIKPNLLKNVIGRDGEQVFRMTSVAKCQSAELFVTCTIQRPNLAPMQLKGN